MNPQDNFSLVSIRQKKFHFDPWTGEAKEFSSINKAKAHSRALGGAGKVKAAKNDEDRKETLKLYAVEQLRREAQRQREAAEAKANADAEKAAAEAEKKSKESN